MTDIPSGRLVARTSVDLIAMVPLALGFRPAESVTVLTFGGLRQLHARVDLPARRRDDPAVLEVLLEPVLRMRAASVAVLVHTTRSARFAEVGRLMVDGLLDADLRVVEVLRVEPERYWCLDCAEGLPGEECAGHPYDVGAHPFTAAAVLAGTVVHGSREELAATLEPGPADRTRHAAVRDAAAGHAASLQGDDLSREGRWLRRLVARHAGAGTRPDDRRLGRLLADLALVGLRDRCWEGMRAEDVRGQVELWRDVVRRAPVEHVLPAAGVLAFAAWLAGDGALAWCAVERGRRAGGDSDLLALVDDLLTRAVPPGEATGPRPRSA